MKKLSFCLACASLLLLACSPGRSPEQEQALSEITALEKQLANPQDSGKVRENTLLLVAKASDFAKRYPQDASAPDLLYRAGEAAKRAKEYNKAIEAWRQVAAGQKQNGKASLALYQQASTFDSELRDPAMAAKLYKEFLKTPALDSQLIRQAKARLAALHSAKPEKLVKNLEEE